jgi:hypothetical protein
MNTLYEHHKDKLRFGYRCFDRILLDGLIQPFLELAQPADIGAIGGADGCDTIASPQAETRRCRRNLPVASDGGRDRPGAPWRTVADVVSVALLEVGDGGAPKCPS